MTEAKTIEFKSSEGFPIAADVYGNPAKNPVLFMHGGGQTRHAWGGAAAARDTDGVDGGVGERDVAILDRAGSLAKGGELGVGRGADGLDGGRGGGARGGAAELGEVEREGEGWMEGGDDRPGT